MDKSKPGKITKSSKTSSSFLDKVRSSKIKKKPLPSTIPSKETLAKAVANSDKPRLLFSFDATGSRQEAWDVARELTGAMFTAVPDSLEVAFAYHSGGRLEKISGFSSDYETFLKEIVKVECKFGLTCLNQILESASDFNRVKALIYIGDCYEEDLESGIYWAKQLKLRGIRGFFFHDTNSEGYDLTGASKAFAGIAEITGGAVFPFDTDSPEIVEGLLSAIAYYSAKGLAALKRLNSKSAQKLLAAIDNSSS